MKRALSILLATAWMMVLVMPSQAEDRDELTLYPADASVFGWSQGEWLGAYITWLLEIPPGQNPALDPSSPRNCESQHGGKVGFLSPAGADCTVPEGAAIVFTPAAHECSAAEGNGQTFRALKACAAEGWEEFFGPETYEQRLWLDGDRLRHQREWVVISPGEIIDFPRNNIYGVEPGPSRSLSKGLLFIVRPPDEGRHVIRVVAHDKVFGDFEFVWKIRVIDH